MGDNRKPMDCRYYPLCQGLQALNRDIPASFSGIHAIVLQRVAESICDKCRDYEAKDMEGAA